MIHVLKNIPHYAVWQKKRPLLNNHSRKDELMFTNIKQMTATAAKQCMLWYRG